MRIALGAWIEKFYLHICKIFLRCDGYNIKLKEIFVLPEDIFLKS